MSAMLFASPCRRSLCAGIVAAVCLHGTPSTHAQDGDVERLFAGGRTWTAFLDAAHAQRQLWLKTTAAATVPADVEDRFRRAGGGLRILAVAEDWCPDSVNALPYVALLASSTSVPLRVVDRTIGAGLMARHRTPDGRIATPTIVLLRGPHEAAAWVERPALVQRWFLSMSTSAESARLFGDRQAWYDADQGRTVLTELTVLAEQTAARK